LALLLSAADQAGAEAALPAAPEATWIPIRPGYRWTYALERHQKRSLNGVLGQEQRLTGELEEEITRPVDRFGDGAFELRETVRGRVEGEAGQHVEVKRSVVTQSGEGYAVLAEEIRNELLGARGVARFEPALEQLPSRIAPGVTWRVGLAQYDGVFVDIQGTILGHEPLETPAGRYERCLKVRYRARVWGEVEVYGVKVPIAEGRFESTEWFAEGVGRVRSDEHTKATLLLATGAELDLEQRMDYSLTSIADTAEAPASPSPAE
jgi:hypothetical protein